MKTALSIAGWALVAYVFVFLLWFGLMAGCIENGNECGGDSLTHLVQKTHGPVLKALGMIE